MRRNLTDKIFFFSLLFPSALVLFTLILIFYSQLNLSLPIFEKQGLETFLGKDWRPSSIPPPEGGKYGLLPAVFGSLYTSTIALLVSLPLSASVIVFLNEIAPKKARTLFSAILDLMAGLWEEVKGRLKDKPWKLSGGQQQRLCLARALAIKPKILLLDEPTANIDPINTVKIEEALKKLAKEGMTIVMVTHMPQQAIRIASHAIFLYHGSVVEQGPISKLAYAPSSELTKNFIYGEVSHLKA
ncbi:MAG: ATP-binding cassette domain-containing protein [Fervidicoccaceae archaeon]